MRTRGSVSALHLSLMLQLLLCWEPTEAIHPDCALVAQHMRAEEQCNQILRQEEKNRSSRTVAPIESSTSFRKLVDFTRNMKVLVLKSYLTGSVELCSRLRLSGTVSSHHCCLYWFNLSSDRNHLKLQGPDSSGVDERFRREEEEEEEEEEELKGNRPQETGIGK
ncbi:unnamed protein product [Pleuronectes platessa]|uniref:Uncharacterized protein n=1 Tax=Pleuronectes platessa TaxID=8262 RepID=A0A9N7VSQ5_PLEPL|nr:unnamed protein product [Pleuronectes platessa]